MKIINYELPEYVISSILLALLFIESSYVSTNSSIRKRQKFLQPFKITLSFILTFGCSDGGMH
jgi:hypothetical protein